MTAKEKAIELHDLFYKNDDFSFTSEESKQLARISVNEILKELYQLARPEITIFATFNDGRVSTQNGPEKVEYWEQVNKELDNL